jgi:hypothetical protein
MPRAKQFTLTVPDRPGLLGEIAIALGERKVNIAGIAAATQGGGGVVMMVTDKPATAKRVLGQHGWNVKEDEVLAVTLSHIPGALGRFASKLGKAGVNITFAYAGSAGSARKLTAYFGVSDMKKALKVRP